ncbi:MAG: hypothetical protein IPM69_13160 [Ignavibacteria bacterium]|nr:hypothetical protein [Ignavibacteria bacterium]
MDTIITLSKGASLKEVQSLISVDPKYSFLVRDHTSNYSIEVFPIQIGVKTTQNSMYGSNTGMSSSSIFTPTTSGRGEEKNDLASDYFFMFDSSNKLIFWGFLQEFSKSEDVVVEGIASKIYEKYYSLKNN